MTYLKLAMVNKNGVKIYRSVGSTKDLALKKLSESDIAMSTNDIATGGFVLGKNSDACIQFGIDDLVWFDESKARSAGLCI